MKNKNNFSKLSVDSKNYLYVRLLPKLISFITVPIILRLITPKLWGEIALMVGLQSLTSALLQRYSKVPALAIPAASKPLLNACSFG